MTSVRLASRFRQSDGTGAELPNVVIVYMLLILGPAFGFKVALCGDNVRPVLVWLIIAFCVVGGLCSTFVIFDHLAGR